MKNILYMLLLFLGFNASIIDASEIKQEPITYVTLKELIPNNNATAFVDTKNPDDLVLDLSSANIRAVTGKKIKLTSLDG